MLRYLTAGESHGQALVVIVEGLPAGLEITVEEIQIELARRRLGYGRGPRQRFEQDELTLIGGVRHGRTLGSPVAIEIENSEWFRSDKWHEEMSPAPGVTKDPLTQVRPGHADLAGMQKYGFTDARDVLERASARETAARVAAGALAKKLLSYLGVDVISHVIQMGHVTVAPGGVRPTPADLDAVDADEVRCFDPAASELMVEAIKAAAKDGDSLGGVVEVLGFGVPVGLGSHVHWDRKLDALLAQALMSIQAVKGVEIGDGFEVAGRPGSQAHDAIRWNAETASYTRAVHARRWPRGWHDQRRAAGGPRGDEAAGHAQPPDARDRRHRDEGVGGVVQGAHRRHRRLRRWAWWPRRWWRSCSPRRRSASSAATPSASSSATPKRSDSRCDAPPRAGGVDGRRARRRSGGSSPSGSAAVRRLRRADRGADRAHRASRSSPRAA